MTAAWRFPTAWVGWWVAEDDRALLVTTTGEDVAVTVTRSPGGEPLRGPRPLVGRPRPLRALPARCRIDDGGARFLEVEAGLAGLGPTYRLHPVTNADHGSRAFAALELPPERVLLIPSVEIGLYDDMDDDLGVPWAQPLLPFAFRSVAARGD